MPQPQLAPSLEAFDSPLRIGAVTLAVRDLRAMAEYYRSLLDLDVVSDDRTTVALASTGETILRLLARPDAPRDRLGEPGLFHIAFLLPSRRHLAVWLARAAAAGLRLTGASDHKVSEALYFNDPEGNGIEVYCDRPRATWVRQGEAYEMTTDRLDLRRLVDEGTAADPEIARPIPVRVGHIHLRAGDLAASLAFYRDALGMAVTHQRPGALWFGWGGYHHHVATNVWSSNGSAPRSEGHLGLVAFEVVARDAMALEDIRQRLGRSEGKDPGGLRIHAAPAPG